jgi:hypothetical protein
MEHCRSERWNIQVTFTASTRPGSPRRPTGSITTTTLTECHWNAQLVRRRVQRPGWLPCQEMRADAMNDSAREPLTHTVARSRFAGLRVAILGVRASNGTIDSSVV